MITILWDFPSVNPISQTEGLGGRIGAVEAGYGVLSTFRIILAPFFIQLADKPTTFCSIDFPLYSQANFSNWIYYSLIYFFCFVLDFEEPHPILEY